jgi:hypothetical protein
MIARQCLIRVDRHRVRGASCRRCGRREHVIDGDGSSVCRVCLFAWGSYAAALGGGKVIPEIGGIRLRHAAHAVPRPGCALCRADQLRTDLSFGGWTGGRGT